MNALDTGLYNAMHNNSALHTGVGGNIFNTMAPEGTAFPYITYFMVGGHRDRMFGTTLIDSALYQIDIWAASNTAAGVVLDLLLTAIDGATLTITGYTPIKCLLENLPSKVWDDGEGAARIITEFRVEATK